MFWSHDLLGKKTALGAIWIAAHGKKLNKSNILKVNVAEACNKVMDPEVPQALRLQAILVGGIVIVHARQQVYLLEDAQEMLRRLRSLDAGESGIDGAGAAPRAVLGEGKRAAREEAITLPLNADLGLMNLGDLFPTFHTQALSEGGASGAGGQGGGDLFVTPSVPDEPEASSGAPSRAQRRGRGRGAAGLEASDGAGGSGAHRGGGLLMLGAEEPDLCLEGLARYDLELMDGPETFAVPDLDMPGMEMFQLPAHLTGRAPAPSSSAGREQPGQPLADELVPVPSALLGEDEGFVPDGRTEAQQEQESPSSQTPQASEERSAGARGAADAPRARGARRGGLKRAKAIVDDIDTLQIRGRDYREWMMDHSDLLVPRPLRALGATSCRPPRAALAATPASAVYLPGGAWPEELHELFARAATIPAAGSKGRTKRGRGEAAAGEGGDLLEEQERLLEGALPGGSRDSRRSAEGLQAPGGGLLPGEDMAGLDVGWGGFQDYGYGEEPAPPGAEAAAFEAGAGLSAFARRGGARQLSHGSDFHSGEEDVETERLRAALNSTQGLEPFFPLGQAPGSGSAGGSLLAGGRGGRGRRASSLLRRDPDSGVLSERSSERRNSRRLSDLPEGGPPAVEDLGALLPVVGEEEAYEEEAGEGGSRHKRRRLGEAEEGSAVLEGTDGLTQFELLEASAPTQALPGGPLGDSLNRQTLAFVGVMHSRFQAAEGQREDGDAAALSLLGMAERLSRMDAAKLFYQALVARSHSFLALEQVEPYGDILLRRGESLQGEGEDE